MSRAGDLVAELVASRAVPGMALVVVDADGVVDEAYAGSADRAGDVPVDAHTRFALASLTKPLVALAVLVAVEEGILELDAPLAGILPGAAPQLTLRGCLAHYAGLPEGAGSALLGLEPEADWAAIAAASVAVAPELPAGERRRYSNIGYALAGLALERASAMPIDAYLHEAVCAPLQLDATTLGLPAGEEAAWVRDAGLWAHGVPLFNSAWFRRQPLPQSAAFATAPDYARFLQAVLRGGGLPGRPAVVAAETCLELVTNQGGALPGGVESFMTWERADWGLGFELRDAKPAHWTGETLGAAAATHFGASGTLCFLDPEAGVGAALLANRGTYSGWMLRAGAWPAIVAAIRPSRPAP